MEEKLDKERASGSPTAGFLIEFCKIVFGGWAVLGFVFLLLFYSPLRDALNAIPEKVKTASEIGALGVSLKSTFQVEAAKLGAGKLSETIPGLSGAAIELLMRAPRNSESLVSYSREEAQPKMQAINLPSSWEMDALSELEAQGLIGLESYDGGLTGSAAREMIDQFIKANPGREASTNDERFTWKLDKPLAPKEYPIMLQWQLTDLGRKAVEVILKAVSTELAPKPSPNRNP